MGNKLKDIQSRARHRTRGPSLSETLRDKPKGSSIADEYPELVALYFASSNARDASEYSKGSGREAQWICPNVSTHPEYPAKINSRVRSWTSKGSFQCCPACRTSKNKELGEKLPEDLRLMFYSSNRCSTVEFKSLTTYSRKNVDWKCLICEHIFSGVVAEVVRGNAGCPRCYAGDHISLISESPEPTTLRFCKSRNGGFDVRSLPLDLKLWWQCATNHHHAVYKSHRELADGKGFVCQICSPDDIVDLKESPRLMGEFCHRTNEGLAIGKLKKRARVNWRCAEGHEFVTRVSERIENDRGCPYCAKKAKAKIETIAQHPALGRMYDRLRNSAAAESVKICSRAARHILWWSCPECKDEWKQAVYSLLRKERHVCPKCGLSISLRIVTNNLR